MSMLAGKGGTRMPFASGYSTAEAQLLITLSGLAYVDSDPLPGETAAAQEARMRQDIDAALAASTYPSWRVVWGPGLSGDRANMLYAAGEPDGNQIAIAVRGTDWSFWLNWLENFASLLPLVPFTNVMPSVSSGNPQIAAGTNIGLQLLLQTEASTLDGDQVDVGTFLRAAGDQVEIFVTGHSLGGCLASVLAPSLAQQLGNANNFKVYTFAAPSAGNQDFASYYNRLFTDEAASSTAFRVFNDQDIVPESWATLLDIARKYMPAPACPDSLKQIIDRAAIHVGTTYRQVGSVREGSAVMLRGQVEAPTAPALSPDPAAALYFQEVDYQHATETYMQLLSAPAISRVLAMLSAARARLLID
jgi:Lipase (class 3)